jgi:glycosyltransferase involved in cell wall biosynthesis
MTQSIDLSVLVPVFNEVDSVEPLHAELDAALRPLPLRYELIFVDDGSTDGSTARLKSIQQRDPAHVRVVFLRHNCGQTAALSAALDQARGEILVPIDGDRQNDPADIPRLLGQLDAGYDVVSGWRKDRQDALFARKVPSWLANRLVARLSGVPLHDFGCTLKAYRRRVLEGVRLYGEMHRFIPIFASWQGAKVIELVVHHRPRTAGKTKYGLGRTFNVVLDLILIRFLQRYAQRPLHFFGRFGLWSFGLCMLSFLGMLYFKYVFPWPYLWWGADLPHKDFVSTPLPSLTVMFFLAGGISILLGIQSELIMRTYYESQAKTTYLLGEIRQGPDGSAEEHGPSAESIRKCEEHERENVAAERARRVAERAREIEEPAEETMKREN